MTIIIGYNDGISAWMAADTRVSDGNRDTYNNILNGKLRKYHNAILIGVSGGCELHPAIFGMESFPRPPKKEGDEDKYFLSTLPNAISESLASTGRRINLEDANYVLCVTKHSIWCADGQLAFDKLSTDMSAIGSGGAFGRGFISGMLEREVACIKGHKGTALRNQLVPVFEATANDNYTCGPQFDLLELAL